MDAEEGHTVCLSMFLGRGKSFGVPIDFAAGSQMSIPVEKIKNSVHTL